jgi:hypothetical protein
MHAFRAPFLSVVIAVVFLPWPSRGTDEEICFDAVDNDGDGRVDCADSDCCEGPNCAAPFPCPIFRRADLDEDGTHSVTDAILVLAALFAGTEIPCAKAADADDSGAVDVTDAVSILQYLFQRGLPPPPPFEDCGRDPTPDALRCEFNREHACR